MQIQALRFFFHFPVFDLSNWIDLKLRIKLATYISLVVKDTGC